MRLSMQDKRKDELEKKWNATIADPQGAVDLRENLLSLQAESLRIIALLTGLVGYTWVILLVWPLTGATAPVGAWVGGILLVGSAIISYTLHERHLRVASGLLLGGVLLAIGSMVLSLQSLAVAPLLILPIILASVLFGQAALFLVTVPICVFILVVGVTTMGVAWYSVDVALPIATIALATVISWLSARNLHVALAWVWRGYEQARQNEQTARERQAELRRALKALDEATYRLERANYMLTLARDQAEEARRLKQHFAQTISHELRTPLSLIVGFIEMMAQSPEYYGGQLPTSYVRDLSIVHRNASHLQTLVNDVLDLARIEAAQMALLPQETDPAALVEEAVNTARSLVEARGLAMRVEIEPDLPQLWVDPARIRQVLFNLLNNAARFTERGSVTVSVRSLDQGEEQGRKVTFAVADTGVGIAPEEIPRIFEEFHQIDGTTRRRHGGAGLGLAISRQFVEMHGGRIWVDSQMGQGSTFYFSLPIRSLEPTVTVPGPSGRVASPIPVGRDPESTLLAVTPSLSAASLLTRYVRGCHTVVVQDLEQGCRAAQQMIPQAVVLDTACEGFDPARLGPIAQAWGLPHVPFLACPLPGEEPLRQRLGVDGYLIKPVARQSLWDMLRRLGEDIDSVLVVDDDRDFVRMLSRMLDSPLRRYQVIGAYDGREGLEMVRYHQPDLVLLDLVLPDIHGFELIELVRSMPVDRHPRIVIISAQDEIDHLEAISGTMFITKAEGLVPNEIVQWVQRLMDTTAGHRPSPNGEGGMPTVYEMPVVGEAMSPLEP
jgi:signal transduction histidine kinase/CheY-like chemotaxis protein